jgi:two-component system sensor histidine kinase DesK
VWLPFCLSNIGDFIHRHPAPVRLVVSLAGVALFFALYLWTTWHTALRLAGASPHVPSTEDDLPASLARVWVPVAAMVALSVALILIDGPVWGVLLIYTSTAAAGGLPLREALGTIAALVIFTLAGLGPTAGIAAAVNAAAFIAVPGGVVVALVRAVEASQQLRAAREEMARLAATSEERLRIARDLHDLLGHNLSLIALKSELAGRLIGAAPERAAVEIGDVERVARTALQEVREAIAGYHSPSLAGELAAARDLLAAAGIAYRLVDDEGASRGLPPALDAALAWAVREGVTNVIRHSHGRSCTIRVIQDAGEVGVEIEDDGAIPSGLPAGQASSSPSNLAGAADEPLAASTGNGLRGVAERMAALGGRCEAGPSAAHGDGRHSGFRQSVRVPLPGANHGEHTASATPAATIPHAVEPDAD